MEIDTKCRELINQYAVRVQTNRVLGNRIGGGRTTGSGPWLTVKQAAERAQCGVKTIYREVKAKRLQAAQVGGRRELRLKPEWVDEWLQKASTQTAA